MREGQGRGARKAQRLHDGGLHVRHFRFVLDAGLSVFAHDGDDFPVAVFLDVRVMQKVSQRPQDGCGRRVCGSAEQFQNQALKIVFCQKKIDQ